MVRPCRLVSAVLDQLADEHSGKAEVVKVNIDEYPGVASKLGINSIPAILLFEGGKLRAAVICARPKQFLEKGVCGLPPLTPQTSPDHGRVIVGQIQGVADALT